MNNPSFVHLDVNTEYTLGRSTIRQDKLIDACVEMGMPAFGVTEHNNLFSAYKLDAIRSFFSTILFSLVIIKIYMPLPIIRWGVMPHHF